MFRRWDADALPRTIRVTGYVALSMSALALVVGLFMVESVARDFRTTVGISGEAIDTVLETVDVVAESTSELIEGVDAASAGVAGVSATATTGAASIEDIATFLETDLAEDLESIESALPGAIQAAGAIDGALNALSFVGVDYAPDEPFNVSLRRVQEALEDTPDAVRAQGDSMRDLVPAAGELAGEADRLSIALVQLGDDLDGIHDIADTYESTLLEAATTIERTDANLDRNMWLLRLTLVALAVGGAALGLGLIGVGRVLEPASDARVIVVP